MRIRLSKMPLFSICVVVGLAVGYLPAMWHFKSSGVQALAGTMIIDVTYTTLRGMVTGVDTTSKTLTFMAVSPFSPLERALLSVHFDEKTVIQSAPFSLGHTNVFLPTAATRDIDASRIVAGTPVTVRLSRSSGTLHAFWIVIGSPVH